MDDKTTNLDRRKFLKGVAVAGAATTVAPGAASAQKAAAPPKPSAARPSAPADAAESVGTPQVDSPLGGIPGSDFMVDVIKSLGIEYVVTNPASSCRGIHESLINYGKNQKPELLTVMHEESGAAMAHGYAKVAGKPIILLCHGTVGLQHATMGIYNAWCDRAPIIVMPGNHLDAASRPPGVPTTHSAQDPISLVRDFTKWDDQPVSLEHFAQSLVRAYKIAMTPPHEPVCIVVEGHLQEHPIHDHAKLTIPKMQPTAPPQGETGAVREAAKLLVNAERPVIVVDRVARTAEGMKNLIELAELLNVPVIDKLGRMNFPSRHYLNQSSRGRALISQADVIVGCELTDYWGTVNSFTDNVEQAQKSRIKPGTKLVSIGVGDLYIRANYQDFQRYQAVDVSIGADAEATLPSLIEACKSLMTDERRNQNAKREEAMRKAHKKTHDAQRAAAAVAWDASPISTARLSAEIWAQIKNEDWALVSRDASLSSWPHKLWNFDKHYQFIGGPGGSGIGYGLPAAVGAALAHRAHGRLAVNIQNDGDICFAPGALWTAVHHKIPMLSIMHNNRAYHQEVMHVQKIGNFRNRGAGNAHIGTTIQDPYMDYAMLAKSMGMYSIGPIDNPNDVGPALKKAIAVVKAGEPALIDTVTQPR